MKTSIKIFVIALITSVSMLITNASRSQVSASVSFSVFHDNLSPYGRWVTHPSYGQIWIANESGFRPYYSRGHWAYTNEGWMWVSDYSWGWAPFHYGRWEYDVAYGGWFWVPGYDWGPAWVSWRTGGDYYGWAPLGVRNTISVGVSFGSTIPTERWVFVPHRYIMSRGINRHFVRNTQNVTIIRNTTIINNTHVTNVSNRNVTYVSGPGREDVEKVTRKKVQTMAVNNSTRPGTTVVNRNKNTINIYKPQVDKESVEKNVHVNVNSNNNNNNPVNSNNKKGVSKNNKKQPADKSTTVKNKKNKKNNNNRNQDVVKSKDHPTSSDDDNE